jgi:hypothetical protein
LFSWTGPFTAVLCLLAALCAACGSGDGGPAGGEQPGGPSSGSGSSPNLSLPVARFALNLDDVPKGYLTDRSGTFVLDAKTYGATAAFESPAKGEEMLSLWGYLGGYETGFEPEQRLIGVLNGQFYVAVEVHLFRDDDGAEKAFTYFDAKLQKSQSQRVSSNPVGNQSSAWKLTAGKVPNSSIEAAYHRVVFRRGNLVVVVQTYGSESFMKIDTVLGLAATVDEKALGKKSAVEPTPLAEAAATASPVR